MAFSLWRLFFFLAGVAPAHRQSFEGYPVNEANGRAGAGETREYYRTINKPPAGRSGRRGREPAGRRGGFS